MAICDQTKKDSYMPSFQFLGTNEDGETVVLDHVEMTPEMRQQILDEVEAYRLRTVTHRVQWTGVVQAVSAYSRVSPIVVKDGRFYGTIVSYRAHGYPDEDGGVGEMDRFEARILRPEDGLVVTELDLWEKHIREQCELVKKESVETE